MTAERRSTGTRSAEADGERLEPVVQIGPDAAGLALRFHQMVAIDGPMPGGGKNRVEMLNGNTYLRACESTKTAFRMRADEVTQGCAIARTVISCISADDIMGYDRRG